MNGKWRSLVVIFGVLALAVLAWSCSSRQCPTGYHEENGECVTDQNPNRSPEDGPDPGRDPAPTPGTTTGR